MLSDVRMGKPASSVSLGDTAHLSHCLLTLLSFVLSASLLSLQRAQLWLLPFRCLGHTRPPLSLGASVWSAPFSCVSLPYFFLSQACLATHLELSDTLSRSKAQSTRPERRAGCFGRVAGELGNLGRLQGGGISESEGFTEL